MQPTLITPVNPLSNDTLQSAAVPQSSTDEGSLSFAEVSQNVSYEDQPIVDQDKKALDMSGNDERQLQSALETSSPGSDRQALTAAFADTRKTPELPLSEVRFKQGTQALDATDLAVEQGIVATSPNETDGLESIAHVLDVTGMDIGDQATALDTSLSIANSQPSTPLAPGLQSTGIELATKNTSQNTRESALRGADSSSKPGTPGSLGLSPEGIGITVGQALSSTAVSESSSQSAFTSQYGQTLPSEKELVDGLRPEIEGDLNLGQRNRQSVLSADLGMSAETKSNGAIAQPIIDDVRMKSQQWTDAIEKMAKEQQRYVDAFKADTAVGSKSATLDPLSHPLKSDSFSLFDAAGGTVSQNAPSAEGPFLSNANTARVSASEALGQYSTRVAEPFGTPKFESDMSEKIVWLARSNIQSAEIHLNPAELGPIEVKVSLQNEQASLQINAQHASVREMLESQVTRLRDMLEQSGLGLDQFDVGTQSQQSGSGLSDGQRNSGENQDIAAEMDARLDSTAEVSVALSDHWVDTFA